MKLRQCMSFTYPCPRKLREVVKISMFQRQTKDQIVKIWMDYHKEKPNNVSYCLSKSEWETFSKNSTESPLFLLPLKRNNGHFMIIGQAQKTSILYTYLDDYKRSATFSSPYFILTMFDELIFNKGVILVRGDVMDYQVTADEAFFLMNQTFRFYLDPNLYQKYVSALNHNQLDFNYEDFKGEFQLF